MTRKTSLASQLDDQGTSLRLTAASLRDGSFSMHAASDPEAIASGLIE